MVCSGLGSVTEWSTKLQIGVDTSAARLLAWLGTARFWDPDYLMLRLVAFHLGKK